MKPVKIDTIDRYQEIVGRYGIRGCFSNDYIQREASNMINHDALFEYCGEKNAFLLVKKDGFWRVYYYINDLEEILDIDREDMATEILFRGNMGEPAEVVHYLESCGFTRNLVRDLYELRYKDLAIERPFILPDGVVIRKAKSIDEATFGTNLFNALFDRFSGDHISNEESLRLLENKQLYVALLDGSLAGALHVSQGTSNLFWMDHLAVTQEARGKHIATGLFLQYIEDVVQNDSTRYSLWTQRQNLAATNLYTRMGFKYVGKSTLSMIKQSVK